MFRRRKKDRQSKTPAEIPEGREMTDASTLDGSATTGWGNERRLFKHVDGKENGEGASCVYAIIGLAEEDDNPVTVQAIVQSHPDFRGEARLSSVISETSRIKTAIAKRDWGDLQGLLLMRGGGPEAMVRPVYCCYGDIPSSDRHYLMAKVY